MATRWVPGVQFHSLGVGKFYGNPMTRPKLNPNPNTNPTQAVSPTKPY